MTAPRIFKTSLIHRIAIIIIIIVLSMGSIINIWYIIVNIAISCSVSSGWFGVVLTILAF